MAARHLNTITKVYPLFGFLISYFVEKLGKAVYMKAIHTLLALLVLCLAACTTKQSRPEVEKEAEDWSAPNDYFFLQRTFPDTVFQLQAYNAAMEQAQQDYLKAKHAAGKSGNNAAWQTEGPGNIGGRFNTIAIPAGSPDTIYAGASVGGVWKTTDGGNTWNPIFDNQAYMAIGDIEIDPNNSNTVYVGTGDPNIGGYPFIGDGLYKSTDAGDHWTHLGLTDTRIISHVEVHPQNSNLIYVSAMGLPFMKDNNRGLYKSTDGGSSWQQVLFLSDSAGVTDLVLDPTDTNTLYVAGWNRVRSNQTNMIYGPQSLIYISTDGGQTWDTIMNGISGVGILSRITIEMSGSDPNVLFASVSDSSLYLRAIYKSINGGGYWNMVNTTSLDPNVSGGFAWYFDQLKVNPADDDQLFVLGVELYRTDNGGGMWGISMPNWWQYIVHADLHDLVIEGNAWYVATDGGLYKTTDQGAHWTDIEQIPVSQFYHVKTSDLYPGEYFGGMQDNGTTLGNAANINNWPRLFGGDGFKIQVHPTDPDIIYMETQYGGIVETDDGGFSFIDAVDGIDPNDRMNWDMPYKISYHNPTTLYAGTGRVYKSTGNSVPYWQPVSPDLTGGTPFLELYHTVSDIEDARTDANIVYAGTSDANFWRSLDAGNTWTHLTTGGLPVRYITDIESSSYTPGLVVVTQSGYRDNDFVPHIHLSTDSGTTWTSIDGDLPDLAINEAEISYANDSIIFVATDGGVYYTINQGAHWMRLGNNMPVMPVYDIEIDQLNSKLVAGTFARSMMSIGIDSILNSTQPILVAQVSADATICAGDSTLLTASGGNNYNWSPGTGLSCTHCANPKASPADTITYTVVVSNSLGAVDTASVTVSVLPVPMVPAIDHVNDSVFITNPQVGVSYTWQFNNTPLPQDSGQYIIVTADGAYRVVAQITGSCAKNSNVELVQLVGLSTVDPPTVTAYPNPFTDRLNVTGMQQGSQWYLYSISGQLMSEGVSAGSRAVLGFDVNIPTGIFYLKLTDVQGKTHVIKLLKQ